MCPFSLGEGRRGLHEARASTYLPTSLVLNQAALQKRPERTLPAAHDAATCSFRCGHVAFVPHMHTPYLLLRFLFSRPVSAASALHREWLDPRGWAPAGPSRACRFMRVYESPPPQQTRGTKQSARRKNRKSRFHAERDAQCISRSRTEKQTKSLD